MQTVALLGVGTMGRGMGSRLLAAGFPLTVWNRSADRARPLADEGAHIASSPANATARADVVLSMLADDDASRSVWLGERGALSGARPDTVLIESSTVTPAWIEELAAAAATAGCHLLDVPVAGSKMNAAKGDLRLFAGGDPAILERVRPVLAAMSRDTIHLGPTGSGARLKLINNLMCGVEVAVLAEVIALIEASGLDRVQALKAILEGSPGSPMTRLVAPRMTERDYSVHFALALMKKDLGYAQRVAEPRQMPLAMAAAAEQFFQRAIDAGHGQDDMAAVVELLR